jgi:hypothetical protein
LNQGLFRVAANETSLCQVINFAVGGIAGATLMHPRDVCCRSA